MSARKIKLLQFLGRPFFEMEQREMSQFMVKVMFDAERIKKGESIPFPYGAVNDPLGLANNMIADMQRETALRN